MGISPRILSGIISRVDPSSQYKFVGNRTRSPMAAVTLSTAIEQMNWIYLGFFPFAPWGFFAGYPMHYTDSANLEHIAPNNITFRGWSIAYSSTKDVNTTTRVLGTVGGSTSAFTIDPTVNSVGFVTDDNITKGQIPANSHVWIMQAFGTPASGMVPANYDFSPNTSLEGASGSGTSQASKLTSGTLTGPGANGSANNYGPSFVCCRGNPNKVALGWGDSIGEGANESLYSATDGKFGHLSRGMAMNNEIFMANMCIPGSSPGYWLDNGRAAVANKLNLIALATAKGNRPFDFILSEHGTNGIGTPVTVTNITARMKSYCGLLKAEFSNAPVHQTTVICKGASTSDGLTTAANQVTASQFNEGGAWWLYNDKLMADKLDGVFDGVINTWTAFGDASDRTKWKVGAFSTTLAVDYVANASTMVINANPTLDYAILLDPLGSGAAGSGRGIKSIVDNGNGTFTISMTFGFNYAKTAGTLVVGNNTIDLIHPSPGLHKAGALLIDAYKTNF